MPYIFVFFYVPDFDAFSILDCCFNGGFLISENFLYFVPDGPIKFESTLDGFIGFKLSFEEILALLGDICLSFLLGVSFAYCDAHTL